MTANLHGIRVVCFYPWSPHEPSGAWTRFTSHWRFLHEEAGAEVTLAFLTAGNDVDLGTLHLRHFGQAVVPFNRDSLVRWLDARLGSRKWSNAALEMLWRYEPEFYLEQPRVAAWLEEIVRTHDVVTCEYPLWAPLIAPFCKKWGRPLVVTSHDTLFELHGSAPQEKEMLKRWELEALRLADARVFCNDSERQFFDKLGLPGLTIRNTSDVRSVSLGGEKDSQLAIAAELKLASAQYCLFVGSDHEPNRKAVDEVRKLAKLTPELSFVVVGRCCEALVDGNFVALGTKPDPYLDRLLRGAFAVVIPLLRGTGASLKLFQALSYGKATVSTPIGARGYDAVNERELLIIPQVDGFAAALRRLAGDEALRSRLERAARDFADQLDFRLEFRPYAETILQLLKRPVSPSPAPAPANSNAPALILVDNNLVDRIGHHFNYALSLKDQCNQAGMGFAALIKRTAAADVASELEAQPVFLQGIHEDSPLNPYPREWGHLRATYDFFLSNDCFARELADGLARGGRTGDIVFLPNATPKQMLGIALLLEKNQIYRNLRFVLLMRYSVIMAAGPFSARKPALDKATAEKYSLAFEVICAADPDGVVKFVTDSDGLAKEFMQFSRGRVVSVLPIPHTLFLPTAAPTPAVPAKDPQRLRIIYLGDAREEKGFAMLPAVVRACHQARQPVEFVFQAFISSPYHQQMAAVIEELDRLNLPQVRLIRTTLDPISYQALLHSADLVLIPHDAVTYHSRTSGTFVEAICADKPVVAPGNSWMSDQLKGGRAGAIFISGNAADFARAVQGAVNDIAIHRQAAAELGRNFREYHNPQNFLQQLRLT